MQALYYAARGNLRWLLHLHPEWSQSQLAHALGLSRSLVGKWIKCLKSAPASDEEVLRGLSRAPHHPPERYAQITGAMVIVGGNIVVGKLISNGFPLFLASTLRFALASALFLLLVLRLEKQFPRIMKKDLFGIVLLSFFGNFLYSIFLLYGLKFTSATESGSIF
jgi:hypothetical protein